MRRKEGEGAMMGIPKALLALALVALVALGAGTAQAADNAAMEKATLALPANRASRSTSNSL